VGGDENCLCVGWGRDIVREAVERELVEENIKSVLLGEGSRFDYTYRVLSKGQTRSMAKPW